MNLLKVPRDWGRLSLKWYAAGTLAGVLLLLALRLFVLEPVVVTSASMTPTSLANERVLVNRRLPEALSRFDVVVLRLGPDYDNTRIIKRIVGLPGDTVRLEEHYRVVINGEALTYTQTESDPPQREESGHHTIQLRRSPNFFFETVHGKTDLRLGPDEYYVLGDNRLASEDSRVFGVVKRSQIEGRALFCWYSCDPDTARYRWERVLRWIG